MSINSKLLLLLKHGRILEMVQNCSSDDIGPFLPLLVKISNTDECTYEQSSLRAALYQWKRVNWITSLYSVDFSTLQSDLKKEQQLREKTGEVNLNGAESGSLVFEQAIDLGEKFRILLSEILSIENNAKYYNTPKFEILDNDTFLSDVSDLLVVACLEMPQILDVTHLCDIIVRYINGPFFVQRIVANFPNTVCDVYRTLIERAPITLPEETLERRCQAVELLCELDPAHCVDVTRLCASSGTLPELFFQMCARSLSTSEMISVLHGVVFGHSCENTAPKQWLVDAFQEKRGIALINRIRSELEAVHVGVVIDDVAALEMSALIRLCCALKLNTAFRLSDNDAALMLNVIRCPVVPSAATMEFLRVGVALLFVYPNITANEQSVQLWMRKLLDEADKFECFRTTSSASYAEMILLIAIHLHSNQTSALSQLISAQLNFKVNVRVNTVLRLKNFLLQDLFPEEVIAERAVRIPVTASLNAACLGFLPIHCVHQLLKNRVFSKHKVVIKNWILDQLKCCTSPVHADVPILLDSFAACCVVPSTFVQKSQQATSLPAHTTFNEPDVAKCFDGNVFEEETMVFRIMLLYFLLLYEENVTLKYGPTGTYAGKSWCYSRKLWNLIPIRFLTDYVQARIENFSHFASALLRLATSKFPYLYAVVSARSQSISVSLGKSIGFTPADLSSGAANLGDIVAMNSCSRDSPVKLLSYLQQLETAPLHVKVNFIEAIASCMFNLTANNLPRQLLVSACGIWTDIEAVYPRRLYNLTVFALVPTMPSILNATDEDVDPLIILKCDEKVFRCGPLLEIILKMLSCYLLASKVHLQQIAAAQVADVHEPEREELTRALVGAQESAVVQILLEACLPTRGDEVNNDALYPSVCLRECRCIIFSYLHQCFINDPVLSKLVHFQGYAEELLPLTVVGIPSMHICLDFIPEMLSQPDCAKHVFAINLLSYLCISYPIPKALSCAKLAVDFVNSLLTALPCGFLADFFGSILASLVRINQVFPTLSSDVCFICLQVAKELAASAVPGDHCILIQMLKKAISEDLPQSVVGESFLRNTEIC